MTLNYDELLELRKEVYLRRKLMEFYNLKLKVDGK